MKVYGPLLSLSGPAWGAETASIAVGLVLGEAASRFGGRGRSRLVLAVAAPLVTLSALLVGPLDALAWSLGLGWSLLALAVIDIVALRLPDIITLPLAIAGLAQSAFTAAADVPSRLAGAAVGLLFFGGVARLYERFRGRQGLGLGDVKLLAAAGAWVGVAALPTLVLLACCIGLTWVAARVLKGGVGSIHTPLPFGSALAAATWTIWLLN